MCSSFRVAHWYHNIATLNHPPAARRLSRRAERGRSFSILSGQSCAESDIAMPSLLRFLTVICVVAGLVYGGMYALANWFNPKPREITVSIPPDKFVKQH
jgi:hypothetical protein